MIEDIPPISELEQGETYHRQRLHDKFGGAHYSGIASSADHPYVFLFTGESGEEFGYEDGFDGETFIYTGEGREGDMEMTGGNKAIRDHHEDGRELHLFKSTNEAWAVTYLGQFELEGWFTEELPDENDEIREAIRFELEPINDTQDQYQNLYLMPVGDEWFSEFIRTVEKPVKVGENEDPPSPLEEIAPARLWGTPTGDRNEGLYHELEPGDIILFYRLGIFFAYALVDEKFESSAVGNYVWEPEGSGLLYTLENYTSLELPKETLWEYLDYEEDFTIMGFKRVAKSRFEKLHEKASSGPLVDAAERALIDKYGPIPSLLDGYSTVKGAREIIEGEPTMIDGYWDMVDQKRERARDFLETPSEAAFLQLTDVEIFWGSRAYKRWPQELIEEHSVKEVAAAFERALETGDLSEVTEFYQMGVAKATEILRALEPSEFAIINKRSKKGMRELGYEPPEGTPSPEEYAQFTAQVREVYEKFNLRAVIEGVDDEPIPDAATPLEIADWAFSRNFEGDIDLSELDGTDTYGNYSDQLSVDFEEIDITRGNLYFKQWDRIKSRVEKALKQGNHILLFGPPGTGKTKLARQICEEGVSWGANEYELVTGSADWSTFDTIGGYQTTKDSGLSFEPGIILDRFKKDNTGTPANEWLIIDELNRADIDKAFGALFSALTGESVTLPFEHDNGNAIEICDGSRTDAVVDEHRFYIPDDWRMISTMNTLDKTSLYEMSYAFMRRWAFIPVGVPELPNPDSENGRQELTALIEQYISVWNSEAVVTDEEHLVTLGEIWYTVNQHRAIGPAIVEDIYRYIAEDGTADSPDFISPIVMYVFPQLEGLRRGKLKSIIDSLEGIVGEASDLRSTAEDFFQADLGDNADG